MARLPKFVKKSEGYELIKQAVIISKRLFFPFIPQSSQRKSTSNIKLFVILLMVWVNVSYCDVIEIISSNHVFFSLLSLSETPHFTTIQKLVKRISMKLVKSVFNKVLKFLP